MSKIVPLTTTEFASKRWQRSQGYPFAASDTVCPLVLQELPKAAMVMPIGFMTQNDQYVPIAVQGIQPGQNLLVAPDGRWLVSYIPAAYRSYPFALGQTEEGQQILCIDEECDLISESEGEPFFDEDGEPTKAVQQIFNFIGEVHKNRQITQRICATLKQHELFEPWPIKLKSGETEKPVAGLYRINEKQLNNLGDEDFAAVRQAGALPLIYCQLLSMQHLPVLAQLAGKRHPQKEADPVPDIDKLFGEGNDLFHFD